MMMMMRRERRRVREEMGRLSTAPEVRCSKHPKHKQSPGVCSVCLIDKLSRLTTTSNAAASSASFCSSLSSSSSSAYSSAYSSASSSYSSPLHHRYRHHSNRKSLVTMFSLPISRNLKGTENGVMIMMRSRSVASGSVVNNAGSEQGESSRMKKNKKTKKLGFWTKLMIGLAGKRRKEVLVHSNSMREKRAKMFY